MYPKVQPTETVNKLKYFNNALTKSEAKINNKPTYNNMHTVGHIIQDSHVLYRVSPYCITVIFLINIYNRNYFEFT